MNREELREQKTTILFREPSFIWCAKWDAPAAAAPCMLMTRRPFALQTVPVSSLFAKNSSLNCFLDAQTLLGFKSHFLQKKKPRQAKAYLGFWCAKWDLNPYVVDTRTSNVPVCLFQHSRSTCIIIYMMTRFVNSFFHFIETFLI